MAFNPLIYTYQVDVDFTPIYPLVTALLATASDYEQAVLDVVILVADAAAELPWPRQAIYSLGFVCVKVNRFT